MLTYFINRKKQLRGGKTHRKSETTHSWFIWSAKEKRICVDVTFANDGIHASRNMKYQALAGFSRSRKKKRETEPKEHGVLAGRPETVPNSAFLDVHHPPSRRCNPKALLLAGCEARGRFTKPNRRRPTCATVFSL